MWALFQKVSNNKQRTEITSTSPPLIYPLKPEEWCSSHLQSTFPRSTKTFFFFSKQIIICLHTSPRSIRPLIAIFQLKKQAQNHSGNLLRTEWLKRSVLVTASQVLAVLLEDRGSTLPALWHLLPSNLGPRPCCALCNETKLCLGSFLSTNTGFALHLQY